MFDLLIVLCVFLLASIPLIWYRFKKKEQQWELDKKKIAEKHLQESTQLLEKWRKEQLAHEETLNKIKRYEYLHQVYQEEKASLLERILILDAALHEKRQQKEDELWFDRKFYLDAPAATGLFLDSGARLQQTINSIYFAQPISKDRAIFRLLQQPEVIRRAEAHYLSILSPVCELQGRLPINLEKLEQEPGFLRKTPTGWIIEQKIKLSW